MLPSHPKQPLTYVERVAWVSSRINYTSLPDYQIDHENKHILATLQSLADEVTQELNKAAAKSSLTQSYDPDSERGYLQQHIKNNKKIISNLEYEVKTLGIRRDIVESGHETKTSENVHNIRGSIFVVKNQVKQLKLDVKELQKNLVAHEMRDKPQGREEMDKLEEELRIQSAKYVSYLNRLKQTESQLQILEAEPKEVPPVYHQHTLLEQLQTREQLQYKEYMKIVKMGEILQRRNQSEGMKYQRSFAEKIRQLEAIIENNSRLDGLIADRQIRILEAKKETEDLYGGSNEEAIGLSKLDPLFKNSVRRRSDSLKLLGRGRMPQDITDSLGGRFNSIAKRSSVQKLPRVMQQPVRKMTLGGELYSGYSSVKKIRTGVSQV